MTLCEAMATGAPCIAPMNTGIKDFFDEEVGTPLKYGTMEVDIRQNYGIKTNSFVPDISDFIAKMYLVMQHYPFCLKKGKKASDRIHKKYTWAISAQRLRDIVQEIEDEYVDKSGRLAAVS